MLVWRGEERGTHICGSAPTRITQSTRAGPSTRSIIPVLRRGFAVPFLQRVLPVRSRVASYRSGPLREPFARAAACPPTRSVPSPPAWPVARRGRCRSPCGRWFRPSLGHWAGDPFGPWSGRMVLLPSAGASPFRAGPHASPDHIGRFGPGGDPWCVARSVCAADRPRLSRVQGTGSVSLGANRAHLIITARPVPHRHRQSWACRCT